MDRDADELAADGRQEADQEDARNQFDAMIGKQPPDPGIVSSETVTIGRRTR